MNFTRFQKFRNYLHLPHWRARDEPIQFYGDPDPEFKAEVREAYADISYAFREYASLKGLKISACRVLSDCLPPGEVEESSVGGRTHWNQAGGCFSPKENAAHIAEYRISDRGLDPVQVTRDLYASGKIDPKVWERPPSTASIVREEFFHGFDFQLVVSCSPTFLAAYEADLAALGGRDRSKLMGLDYLTNDRHGHQEVFASLADHFHRGGPNSWVAFIAFPRCRQFVGEYLHGFTTVYPQGVEAVETFNRWFGENRVLPPDGPGMVDLRDMTREDLEPLLNPTSGISFLQGYGHQTLAQPIRTPASSQLDRYLRAIQPGLK